MTAANMYKNGMKYRMMAARIRQLIRGLHRRGLNLAEKQNQSPDTPACTMMEICGVFHFG